MGTRVQLIKCTDRPDSYTVVGSNDLPIGPAHEFLRFIVHSGRSPNTVKAYARGLARWWSFLEATGERWDDFATSTFGAFLTYLRYGDIPGVHRISEAPRLLAESSVQTYSAAVLAMYSYHADAHHLTTPHERLFRSRRLNHRRNPYRGFRHGIGPEQAVNSPIYRVRARGKATTPILEPHHVARILDACSTQDDGLWTGPTSGLRDRLLFAVMAETGMRLGEALSLRHHDVHIGGGSTPFIDIAGRDDHPHGLRAKSGPRRIYIGDDLAALYSEYVWCLVDLGAQSLVDDLSSHFVFVNLTRGTRFAPMRVETVYSRVRSIRAAVAGLPERWSPHWLRHTHATALLLNGVSEHVVMRRLGHADIQTTVSIYGWVTEDAEMRTVAEWKNYAAGWKGIHG